MAMTVTATMSGTTANEHIYLWIRVLTGATEGGGASASGIAATGGTSVSKPLTPAGSNSLPVYAITGDNDTTTYTALANNTVDSFSADTDTWGACFGHYSGTVTGGTGLTFGVNIPGGGADYATWACYEVQASGGSTPAVDASSPALASATGAGIKTVTSASFTPPAGAVVAAMVCCGGTGSSGTMVMTITDTAGLGLTWTQRAGNSPVTDQSTFVVTTTIPGGGAPAAPLMPPAWTRPWRPALAKGFGPAAPFALPPLMQPPVTWQGTAALSGAGTLTATLKPYIAGLAGTGAGYFADQSGQPRMWLGDEIWALLTNAGRWNSGNYQATFDSYFATRAAQGYTVCYSDMFGSTFIGGAANGQNWAGDGPFTGGNPSSGLNGTYWQVIDYALNSALASGITIALSFGGHWDWDVSGNSLFGLTSTQYSDAGNAIGTRYKNQPNLIWLIMDDYFGSFDSSLSSLLTGLRASGDAHPIAIENYAETSSRFDLSTNGSLSWGASNTQYNFGYSYSCSYLCTEYMFGETSPLTPIYGDGYFYQGGSTYQGGSGAGALDRAIRQDAWWAVTSGARGWNIGDEALWQWPSSAPASVATQWFAANNAGNIRAFMESLPGWQTLVPDTSSALVTAGRGTRGTQFASGGGGGQYEPATTNSFVSASRTPDSGSGSALAVAYLPNHTTITIDQTKMVTGYAAFWVDPVTGAQTSTTAGSTYNSTAQGSNSKGDPDWVLLLQAPSGTSATASLSGAGSLTAGPQLAATASLSGSGTLTGSAAGNVTGSATLTGTGTLTATPQLQGAAPLSGAGSLTAAPQLAGTAPLSGLGSLTAAPRLAAAAALSGTGTLSATWTLQPAASLSGAGTLTGSPSGVVGASLSGAGTLAAAWTLSVPAVMSGAGTLIAVPGTPGAASLNGLGRLTALPAIGATAALSGLGTLTAALKFPGTAALSGIGTLISGPQGGFTVGVLTAATASQGTLTAATQTTGGPS